MRAADNWDSPHFSGLFLALGFFCPQAESSPAQLQLTQTVSHLSLIQMGVLTLYIQGIILSRNENPIHSPRCCL
jgi:hypothetical protein